MDTPGLGADCSPELRAAPCTPDGRPTAHVLPTPGCRKLRVRGFFHAVVRYGYMDRVSHNHEFVGTVMEVRQGMRGYAGGGAPREGPQGQAGAAQA